MEDYSDSMLEEEFSNELQPIMNQELELNEATLGNFSLPELKMLCRIYGLATLGTKSHLVRRLVKYGYARSVPAYKRGRSMELMSHGSRYRVDTVKQVFTRPWDVFRLYNMSKDFRENICLCNRNDVMRYFYARDISQEVPVDFVQSYFEIIDKVQNLKNLHERLQFTIKNGFEQLMIVIILKSRTMLRKSTPFIINLILNESENPQLLLYALEHIGVPVKQHIPQPQKLS